MESAKQCLWHQLCELKLPHGRKLFDTWKQDRCLCSSPEGSCFIFLTSCNRKGTACFLHFCLASGGSTGDRWFLNKPFVVLATEVRLSLHKGTVVEDHIQLRISLTLQAGRQGKRSTCYTVSVTPEPNVLQGSAQNGWSGGYISLE